MACLPRTRRERPRRPPPWRGSSGEPPWEPFDDDAMEEGVTREEMAEMLEATLAMLWLRLDRLEDRIMTALADDRRVLPAPSEIVAALRGWWRRR